MKEIIYNKRLIARMVIETETPLAIGSGEKDIKTDKLVVKDVNGMPYIPGSSLAGVLRHSIKDFNRPDSIFGFQKGDEGKGSRILFTDGVMLGEDGIALDGLQQIPNTAFYERYSNLPIRQHVRMNESGTAEDKGKFDEQVVFKGTRFVFEMELVYTSLENAEEPEDEKTFNAILKNLCFKTLRFGSGTRNGFGKIKIVSIEKACLDLTKENDMEQYISKTSRLDQSWPAFKEIEAPKDADSEWTKYDINLRPKDFFLFGAGFGDDDADMIPVTESIVTWNNGKPSFVDDGMVIPGTSVKGALSHRATYYWHKKQGIFADKQETLINKVNTIVNLFGKASDDNATDDDDSTMGNVIIDDIIIDALPTRIINHVAIDRFTGGTINGALFQEKVADAKIGQVPQVSMTIYVRTSVLDDESIKYAWEMTLKDLCSGNLPLGGGTNRGNGVFVGEYKIG